LQAVPFLRGLAMKSIKIIPLTLLLTILCVASESKAQYEVYSSDLDDVGIFPIVSARRSIGDLGKVEKIIDLRGFLPLSMTSNKKALRHFFRGGDNLQYYKFPIKNLSIFYYGGDFTEKDPSKSFSNVPIIPESNISGDDELWAKLAYSLTKGDKGEELYKKLVGSSGFVGAEPIAILFTDYSAFIVVNFRWSSFVKDGTGQSLFAFEISRKLKEFKHAYYLYDNSNISKNNAEVFKASLPFVIESINFAFQLRGLR
jgi:hypothetical protein